MAGTMNLNAATTSSFSSLSPYAVSPRMLDSPTIGTESSWQNTQFYNQYGKFLQHPEAQSAITMKAIWTIGKGYECDSNTKVILDHISGNGKQSFADILLNVELQKYIGGDGFAEIIRDKEKNIIINLKALNPATMKIVYDEGGMIVRYEQTVGGKTQTWKPREIFHRSRWGIGDSMHGLSAIDQLASTIEKDLESFDDVSKVMHRQARPFIIWKMKTDDATKIATFKAKVDGAMQDGENLYVPDDENLLTWEIVEISPAEMLLAWRNELRNRFFRTLAMPQVIFGSGGSTEANGKMEYLSNEQVFAFDQKDLEDDIWNQLYLKVKFIPPVTLMESIQSDQGKDGYMQGGATQPQDMQAAAGT